jgi:hypothetical protein
MGYISTSGFGEFSCGRDCACKACRSGTPNLAEVYEEDDQPEAPQPPRRRQSRRTANLGGVFEEPPLAKPRISLLPGQLRMPPLETIYGFAPGQARLTPEQAQRIGRLAQYVAGMFGSNPAPLSIRLVGYIDENEWDGQLGAQRAAAVQVELGRAIAGLNPGLAARIQFTPTNCGFSTGGRRVEVVLWVGPSAPPAAPCSFPLPSPAEVARRMVPIRPETAEERVNRILRTLPPPPLPRRSFNQMFWQRVDQNLDSVMNRAGVPQSLRGPLRDGAHAAITRGAGAVFDQVLDAAGLTGATREALSASVRAAMELPLR